MKCVQLDILRKSILETKPDAVSVTTRMRAVIQNFDIGPHNGNLGIRTINLSTRLEAIETSENHASISRNAIRVGLW